VTVSSFAAKDRLARNTAAGVSLAYANHLSPEQLAAAGGIPSMGQEPYHATYNY